MAQNSTEEVSAKGSVVFKEPMYFQREKDCCGNRLKTLGAWQKMERSKLMEVGALVCFVSKRRRRVLMNSK